MSGFSWNAANWSSILSWVEELWGEGKLEKERGGGRRREEEEGGVGGGRRGNEGEGKREGGRRKEKGGGRRRERREQIPEKTTDLSPPNTSVARRLVNLPS